MNNLVKFGLLFAAIDQVTSPLRTIQGAIDRTGRAARSAFGEISNLSRSVERFSAAGKKMQSFGRGALFAGGAAAAGLGLSGVPREAAEAEHALRSLANVGDLSNKQVAEMQGRLLAIARATNQTQAELIQGMNTLVASGLDPRIATDFMPTIGKAATATGATIDDLSKTAFSVFDNLKVPMDRLQAAMDTLSQAGKEGRFELKDMAAYFPQLTAGVAALGAKGPAAVSQMGAALQIAMKGAGDPAEAANNFKNFLQKITAKETVKNFAKFGIDVKSELNKAIRTGIDPIEHMMGLIQKATGGDKFKLSEIFGDMQVTNFITPMLQNMEEYRRIREKTAKSTGVVDKDFQAMMTTTIEQWKQLKVTMAGFAIPALAGPLSLINRGLKILTANAVVAKGAVYAIGAAVAGGAALFALGTAAAALPKLVDGWKMVSKVVKAATVETTLFRRVNEIANSGNAWAALKWQAKAVKAEITGAIAAKRLWIATQWSALRANFLTVSGLKGMAASFGSNLVQGIRAAALAVRGFSITLLTTPIGWIGLAVAGAALLIYRYWKPISGFFKGLWSGLKEGLKGLEPAWDVFKKVAPVMFPIIAPLKWIWNAIRALLKPVDDTGRAAENMGLRFGRAIGRILTGVLTLPGRMLQAGMNIITSLTDGMLRMINKPAEVMKKLADKIRRFLPFSPAKEGPLKDIHRIRLVETIAEAVKPAPLVKAMRATTAAAMMAATPAMAQPMPTSQTPGAVRAIPPGAVRLPATRLAAGSGGAVNITFSPVINVQGGGGNPEQIKNTVSEGIRPTFHEFERLMKRYEDQKQRRSF